jgi:rhamnulose-1-phosphate aldolase
MKSFKLSPAIQHLISDIALTAGYLWERGWAVKNSGNISLEVTEEVDILPGEWNQIPYQHLERPCPDLARMLYLVTGAGTRMREVGADVFNNLCMIRISNDGTGYQSIHADVFNSHIIPTSELPTHIAIHQLLKKRGGIQKAVLHTHPDELIALTLNPEFCSESSLNKMLLGVQPETAIAIPDGIGFVPYIFPGTEQLAEKTAASLQHHPIILWGKHGCLAVGKDVLEAFDLIDIMNKSAQLCLLCRSAGFIPEGLTDHQVEELKRKFLFNPGTY